MTDLRRTKANGFGIERTVTLGQLEEAMNDGRISDLLIPVDDALEEYPVIKVSEAQAKRFRNGGELSLERLRYPRMLGYFRVYDPDKNFIGIGEIGQKDCLEIKRVFMG